MDTLKKITSCKKPNSDPFCQLIAKMPVLLVIFTRDGKTLFVNEVLCSVTGYPPEEIVNFNWKTTLYPDKKVQEEIDKLLDRVDVADVYDYEADLRHRDGHFVSILWSVTKLGIFRESEEVYLKFGIDITPRKEAEKNLRNNRQQFKQLADLAEEGIFIHDGRKVLNANRKAYGMFGYEHYEYRDIKDINRFFTLDSLKKIFENFENKYEGPYEIEGIKKDGSVFPVQLMVKAIPIDDENLRVVTIRDLTEIKKAEEETRRERDLFSTIVETSPTGILMFDDNARITFANDFAEKLLRLKLSDLKEIMYDEPEAEVRDCSGKPLPREELPFYIVKSTEKPVRDVCLVFTWSDGSEKVLSINASPLFDEKGKLNRVITTVEDITDRVRIENELLKLNRSLEERAGELAQINAQLERFAFIASHDLKEPLSIISGYAKLLAKKYRGRLDEEADEFIQYIVDDVSRMYKLINSLLEISRVSTRGRTFKLVDTDAVIDRAIIKLKRKIRESGAEITREELPELLVDEHQMVQVFINLIDNAIKFRREEPPRIHIRAENENGKWILMVSDNGIGIEPKYFGLVFQLFQHVGKKEQNNGTGVGLPVCRKIINRHGGDIWITSEPGKGSTFYFSIPKPEMIEQVQQEIPQTEGV
jgi:PAS domain S-box-containing protein